MLLRPSGKKELGLHKEKNKQRSMASKGDREPGEVRLERSGKASKGQDT